MLFLWVSRCISTRSLTCWSISSTKNGALLDGTREVATKSGSCEVSPKQTSPFLPSGRRGPLGCLVRVCPESLSLMFSDSSGGQNHSNTGCSNGFSLLQTISINILLKNQGRDMSGWSQDAQPDPFGAPFFSPNTPTTLPGPGARRGMPGPPRDRWGGWW